jgi:hypothetical protein
MIISRGIVLSGSCHSRQLYGRVFGVFVKMPSSDVPRLNRCPTMIVTRDELRGEEHIDERTNRTAGTLASRAP